jgi:hypothetical protein
MNKFFLFFSLLGCSLVTNAQSFGVIFKGSTTGVGVDLGYRLNNRVLLKLGFDKFDYNFNTNLVDGKNSVNLDAKAGVGSISLLADIKLYKKLYVSTGLLTNNFSTTISGSFNNDVKFGDVMISKDKLGAISWTIAPKQTIAPYLGFGIGDNLNTNHKVNFSVEFGVFYQGATNFSILSSGIFMPNSDPNLNQAQNLSSLASDYKLYPVIKLNMGVRLFTK